MAVWGSYKKWEEENSEKLNNGNKIIVNSGSTTDDAPYKAPLNNNNIFEVPKTNNVTIKENTENTYSNRDKVNKLLTDIAKSKFSYNPDNDPLYKMYSDAYKREGERASKSTLADIATAQGGVSSYAASAAQQASNLYAQELANKIPELEALAYEKYNADLNKKYNMLNQYQYLDEIDYQKYRDKVNDAYREQQRKDYNEQWLLNREDNRYQADISTAYNLVQGMLSDGKKPPKWALDLIDMPEADAQKYLSMHYFDKLGLGEVGVGTGIGNYVYSAGNYGVQNPYWNMYQSLINPQSIGEGAVANDSAVETDPATQEAINILMQQGIDYNNLPFSTGVRGNQSPSNAEINAFLDSVQYPYGTSYGNPDNPLYNRTYGQLESDEYKKKLTEEENTQVAGQKKEKKPYKAQESDGYNEELEEIYKLNESGRISDAACYRMIAELNQRYDRG